MAALRALTVTSIVLLLAGAGLLGWSLAPPTPGVDAAETVLDRDLTGPAKNFDTKSPFARLDKQGGTYQLHVTAKSPFVLGERRADRPDDPIAESGALSFTAGGDVQYYLDVEFDSTVSGDNLASPAHGPKVFFIKFPDAAAAQTFHATALFTPTGAAPLIALKSWASLLGLAVAAIGLLLFVVRAALPAREGTAAEEPPSPPGP